MPTSINTGAFSENRQSAHNLQTVENQQKKKKKQDCTKPAVSGYRSPDEHNRLHWTRLVGQTKNIPTTELSTKRRELIQN
jgi:hypothetical protein